MSSGNKKWEFLRGFGAINVPGASRLVGFAAWYDVLFAMLRPRAASVLRGTCRGFRRWWFCIGHRTSRDLFATARSILFLQTFRRRSCSPPSTGRRATRAETSQELISITSLGTAACSHFIYEPREIDRERAKTRDPRCKSRRDLHRRLVAIR